MLPVNRFPWELLLLAGVSARSFRVAVHAGEQVAPVRVEHPAEHGARHPGGEAAPCQGSSQPPVLHVAGQPVHRPQLLQRQGLRRLELVAAVHVGRGGVDQLTLHSLVLQLAAQRLTGGREPLARIAADIGYDSEAAFSRAFKRQYGKPPAAWRSSQSVAGG